MKTFPPTLGRMKLLVLLGLAALAAAAPVHEVSDDDVGNIRSAWMSVFLLCSFFFQRLF